MVANGRSPLWRLLAISLLLFLCASAPRFTQPDVALSLDEAEYALAAQKGFIANHLDRDDTRYQRHFHGPMIAYMIHASVQLFGQTEKTVRFPSRLIGAVTCLLLFWGCFWVDKNGFWMGALAGMLLAVMPVHAHVSGVANMHALATLLIVLIFFLTVKTIIHQKPLYLYSLAIALGVLFCTIEYGFILSLIVLLSLLLSKNSHFSFERYHLTISRHFVYAVLLIIATILMIWFAGVTKLHLLKNLIYYLHYSKHGHPIQFRGELTYHVPWWAYLYWFIKLAPTWLAIALAGTSYFFMRLIKGKWQIQDRVFAIFFIVLLVALFRQHIMSVRYSVYLIPFFCLLGARLFDDLKKKWPIVGIFLLGTTAISIALTDWRHIHPSAQGDPGYKEAALYLQTETKADDKILTWYQPILRFYLPGHQLMYNYNSGGASAELLSQLQNFEYRYVIFYVGQIRRWPKDPGYLFVKEHYILCHTIYFKGEPVIWIYKSPDR